MEVTKTIVVQVQVHEMDEPSNESVANTAESASASLTETTGAAAVKSKDASKSAGTAEASKTKAVANGALKVAMPVLNAATSGMAGQVMGHVNRAYSFINAVSAGSATGVIGAVASGIAWGVGQAVNHIMTERKTNEAIVEDLEQTNLRRQIAGLSKIEYEATGLTKKLVYK